MAYEVRALIIHFSERSIYPNIKYSVPGNIVQKLFSLFSPSSRYNLIVYVQDVSQVKCLLFKWQKKMTTTLNVAETWDKV